MNKSNNLACFYLDFNLDETEGVFITNVLLCVLNSLFSLTTSVGNFVILHAIRKAHHLHSPAFMCCLAFSDFLVGAICQPFLVAYIIAEIVGNFNAYCTLRMSQLISSYILSGVSLHTLSAVSIDRLLALTLHLRYNSIVTVPRVFQTVFVFWIFSIIGVMLRFWMSNSAWSSVLVIILLLTFMAIAFSTAKIFHIVRRHQRQINEQNMAALSFQTNTVNALKCKKSAVTVLYIYGLLFICSLPFDVTVISELSLGYTKSVKVAYGCVVTAVFINSLLNPLVYCWRIREIQQAVKNVLRRD